MTTGETKIKSPVVKLWQENKESEVYRLRQFILENSVSVMPELKNLLTISDIQLDRPANESFGDYSTNVALKVAGKMKQSPKTLAEKIATKLNESLSRPDKPEATIAEKRQLKIGEMLEKTEVAGGGFINLRLQTAYLITQLSEVLTEDLGDRTIQNEISASRLGLQNKKIMVEFAHPNTHKEFHIGHLRNISVGESLVRILAKNGAKLFRANYEGDVGLHVAKAIWGVRKKIRDLESEIKNLEGMQKREKVLEDLRKLPPPEKAEFLGQGYASGSRAYEEDATAKGEIMGINKEIYRDPKSVEFWEETRSWSLDYFDSIYKRLGTHFDRLFFESEVEKRGRQIVSDHVKTGVFIKDKDGSIYFPGEHYRLNNCVFVTRENYATYEGKEMALEELEYKTFPFDLDIHVVAIEQRNFFQIAFTAASVLFPEQKGKQYHLEYGMVNLKGGKLSSRTGEVITADELVDEAKSKVNEIVRKSATGEKSELNPDEAREIAEKVAVGAVKYSMLKVNPLMDIHFDIEESISLEGDSGPYLQYTYARCRSVLRKSKVTHPNDKGKKVYHNTIKLYKSISYFDKLSASPEEKSLLRAFLRFGEVAEEAAKTLSPNLICGYLFDLSQKFNLFYNRHSILNPASGDERPAAGSLDGVINFRLALTEATAKILKQGLYLLGIETVERM